MPNPNGIPFPFAQFPPSSLPLQPPPAGIVPALSFGQQQMAPNMMTNNNSNNAENEGKSTENSVQIKPKKVTENTKKEETKSQEKQLPEKEKEIEGMEQQQNKKVIFLKECANN
jgi:hypothetical protein